jgi:hypothetical protein
VPPVRVPPVRHPGPQPEQLVRGAADVRRGVAQQPPPLPVGRPAGVPVVRAGRELPDLEGAELGGDRVGPAAADPPGYGRTPLRG